MTGASLALVAGLVVVLSGAFGLELESAALLGAALGAVVALVPDRTPLARLGGFVAGFVVAFVGYAVRALALPDSTAGRAVVVVLVVLLCVAVTAASLERLPLWSTLLGAAAVAGGYEFTFAAAVPEMATTSVSTATTLLLNIAIGFTAAAFVAPGHPPRRHATTASTATTDTTPTTRLGELMTEKTL
ncbi:asparagine N-glycosylation enzyme membrane subunit Stt3 [Nocardioides marinisabuli]|uniref:Asparagine N-glycosylation enzyme membrane subunit Stt3 n=1 Tax=Nocardioides marinisabuli TaxID=419476 RepID=A0A7Y9F695_9ACTN|nr:hypothetical protein [Nocardioides marinisabuli]NYD59360.1 asparagine N-glycosylation enzyme membrane subunit Stt3 [Nocardioides marinisabuli]